MQKQLQKTYLIASGVLNLSPRLSQRSLKDSWMLPTLAIVLWKGETH